MAKTNDKDNKSIVQFWWSAPMDRVMLDTLADEAQLGNKPSNTFKHSSFVRVAKLVTDKFGVQCVPKHVENHLRTIKGTWNTITKLCNKSGFGWDDNLRMITCSKESYDEEVTAHPTHEKFSNKKIEMYDEMSIVVGKDMATGCFAKSFIDIDMEASPEVTIAENERNEFEDVTKNKETSSAVSSKSRSHRKRGREDRDSTFDNKVAQQLGEDAIAIKKLSDEQVNTEDLYKEVMKTKGFDEEFLGSVFDHLLVNKDLARGFMVKSENHRKKWIEKFMTQDWRGY